MWSELKRKEVEYDRRRAKRVQYFESVRTAQTVQIEDIPLPDMTDKPSQPPQPQLTFSSVPMPADFQPSIAPPNMQQAQLQNTQQKVSDTTAAAESKRKVPPGCPSVPPPDLFAMRELDSDYESSSDESDDGQKSPVSKKQRRYSSDRSSSQSDEHNSASDSEPEVPKPTSVQQRILAIAGQKYDDFMKDLENVYKKDRKNSGSDENQTKQKEDKNRNQSNDESDSGSDERNSRNSRRDEPLRREREERDNRNADIEPPKRDNPAAIPNISSVPAPPMPPPMLKLPTGPPPPPMG